MFKLPPPLAALSHWKQFIVFKLVPSKTRPGKTDKFPVDYRTGRVTQRGSGAHDPAIWLDVDSAATYAEALGPDHGVGFVFTEADDLWFCDIDDCLTPDGWNDWARYLMSVLNGAAWEISSSGKGLHGFGRGRCPPHKTKYFQAFEFYTSNRFVALTGRDAVGEINTDHTAAITQLVADYLVRGPDDHMGDWTTEPVPEWRGNTDDDQLIKRMIASAGGVAATMGYRATFQQLWEADPEALAKHFPENNPSKNRPFDPTRADGALAQALAFWTGKDCARMERLMRRSGLVRDKWDDHSTYMDITIRNAVGRQTDVLQDKPPALPDTGVVAVAGAPVPKLVEGSTFINPETQLEMFQGCVWVESMGSVLAPGGKMIKPELFRTRYGGLNYVMDARNERMSRDAWEAFTKNEVYRPPMADDTVFRPKSPPAALFDEDGKTYVNTWWPIQTASVEGDAGPFVRHMEKLFTDERDREIITSYIAAIVQYPGSKFQWAPLIQGIEGNGKTFIVTAISRAVGDRYMHLPNINDLAESGGKFTAWLRGKLFLGFEEVRTTDRRSMVESLKQMVTNSRMEIQAKGVDQTTGDNCANIVACSNHKDAIPKSNKDRRWAIFYTAQQEPGDLERDGFTIDYMPGLWTWANNGGFAVINHYLQHFPIKDEFNPATLCHRAPMTTSTAEAIELSAGSVEQEITESIEAGAPGFCNGWVSSHYLDALLKRMRMEKAIPPNKRRDLLRGMGYEWHGAFGASGRSPIVVKPDGVRPRLFMKKGHIANNITDPRQAAKRYEKDQIDGAVENAMTGT